MFRFVLLFVCLPALSAGQSIVLIGGEIEDSNAAVYNRIIQLAGGRTRAKIGVMPTANQDPEGEGNAFVDVFRRVYGVNATYIPVTRTSGNVDDPDVAELVRQQTGIFFVGGNRPRVLYTLIPDGRDSLVMTAIRRVLRDGGVVAGTSAGMCSLGDKVMIIDGGTWDGLVDGVFANTGFTNHYPDNLAYDPTGGIGLFSGFMLDSHFSEMGREARLIKVLHETRDTPGTGTTKGIGVDENTALVVTDLYTRPIGTVIGTNGGVFYVDVEDLIERPSATSNYEVKTAFLTVDDTIDLTTGAVTFASWKQDLNGGETLDAAVPSDDVFSTADSGRWRSAAKTLVRNKKDDVSASYSSERNPQFQVVMDRQAAVRYGATVPGTTVFAASYRNMTVLIRPVQ